MRNNTPAISVTQFIFLVILGIAIFFVIAVFRGPGQAGSGLTQVSTPSETNSPTLTPSPSLTANPAYPGPESTQTVAAAVTRKAILYATYLASTPEVSTPALYPTGIFNDPNIYDTGRKLFIDATNEYGGYLNGKRFTLFAGALLDDPQQGLVYFFMSRPTRMEKFLTPTRHGAVHLVGGQNNRFDLIAEDGTEYFFDLPTGQYISSMTELAPTVTPSPIPGPNGSPYPLPPPSDTVVP